jgi:hypothetical protein
MYIVSARATRIKHRDKKSARKKFHIAEEEKTDVEVRITGQEAGLIELRLAVKRCHGSGVKRPGNVW